MNIKTTLALFALVGAGVLLWIFGDPLLSRFNPSARPASATDHGTRKFLEDLHADKITRVEVRGTDGVPMVELMRKPDGAWSLPGNWPLRDAEVNALIDRLTNLRSRFGPRPIDDDNDLADMGLDRPAIIVKLTAGGDEHALAFGEKHAASHENRFARDTYLRLDKQPEALRLPPGLIAALDKSRDYYQQRRLFQGKRVAKEGGEGEKVERLTARSVRVMDEKSNGAHFTLDRHDNDWQLAEPVRDRIDTNTRDALLAAVPDIWAEQFVPLGTGGISPSLWHVHSYWDAASIATDLFFATQGGLLVRSGLIDPERTLTVKYDNGDTVSLQIGGVSGRRMKMVPAPSQPGMPPGMPRRMVPTPEEYRYAKLQYNDQVFEIKADKLRDVFVALDTLRDSHIARFNTADARRVEIQHGGEDIVLEKDKDNWKLIKPLAAEADASKVTDLLTKLSDLQARDKDIIDKDDPKKFGFDKPDAVVKVTIEEEVKSGETKEKKTRTLTVRVGKHDKDKKKLYVMADDWPRINIVDDSLEPLVDRSALAYRGKRLFDFNAADVARIDIDNQGKKLTLQHDKDVWRLAAPAKAEADASKVDQLLADLGHLEAAEYVEQSPKKDELQTRYGLGKPPLTVHIEFNDKKKAAKELHVGKARDGKEGYFARVADGGPVFAINGELREKLENDSLSYRPQNLWQIPPEDIDSLRIHKEGRKEYVLTRGKSAWKISGPFEANALAENVRKMTAELGSPKAESYKAHQAKDLAEYGLDKPALSIAIKAKAKEHTLLIGKVLEGASGRYAKRASEPVIFTVADALIRAVDRPALDLLDRTLMEVEPAKLERVQIHSDDNTLTLEKQDKGWRMIESPAGEFPIDSGAASRQELLWSNLQAERFADYGKGIDWAKYGLDKPAVRVTVKAGKTEHTVDLGKSIESEPGARYARVDKGAGVAVLPLTATRALTPSYLDYVRHDILKFDAGAALALQRHMGENILEVVKKDDDWQMAKPAKEKADDRAMRQLFEQLGNLRAERIAASPVEDLQPFGLDSPLALLTIKLAGDQKPDEHIIKLGKSAGKSGGRFALVDDGKTVAVLSSSLSKQLMGAPVTFRDRTIAHFADADHLQLDRGSRHAVFSKIDGSWKLTEPLQSGAEQDQLNEFIGSLGHLRADALVANKPAAEQLKKYGLDRPQTRWRVRSGDKEVLNLLVGSQEPKGERRYAKLAKGGLVFLLDASMSRKVLDEYRSRTVWLPPLDAVQIESLNYRYNRNSFLLEKDGSDWHVAGKPNAKINAATVEDTSAALAGLKLSRYVVDKGANLALFGLDKPELTLEAMTRSGKRVLHIGNVEGNSKGRYARISDNDRGDVFVLDEETCTRIMRDLSAFGRPPTQSSTAKDAEPRP